VIAERRYENPMVSEVDTAGAHVIDQQELLLAAEPRRLALAESDLAGGRYSARCAIDACANLF
jgi:hypothetical protein